MGVSRRGATTFVVGAAAGVVACALLTTGVLRGGADLVGAATGLFRVPSVAADELPAFEDCDQLRQWYVDRALPQVGPYGFGGGPILMYTERSTAGALDAASPDTAVGNSGTGTNTQEADVDEADVAKTDGSLVVRISGRELVVTDVAGDQPRELSRTSLPGPALNLPELLLRDRHVLVVGDEAGPVYWRGDVLPGRIAPPIGPQETRARVISFDLSDPSAPQVTDQRTVDGGAISTREYADGTVRVVVTTGYPPLDFVQPNRDRTPREATRANKEIVRAAPIDAWLPSLRTDGGAEQPLVDCVSVRHPRTASGFGTISLLTFPFDDPGSLSATAVTAAGDLVYSSADRLYVATTDVIARPIPRDLPTTDTRTSSGLESPPTTQVHAFALDGPRTSYVASGSFPGQVKDRWSFSEYDGHLRVAVQQPRSSGRLDNGVLVFREDDDRLVETGRVDGLGRDESIQSVRWFGNLAVVVTFRQTDPLYTIDLSDPARPRVLGALKIPGFSSYLHPVGGDVLVGIGHDATTTGADLGAQAATFDLRDLADVRRMDRIGFGPQTDVSVGLDPRTFAYLPAWRTLVTPVQDWATGRSRFVALHVADDGTLSETGSWVTQGYAGDTVRTLPLAGGRVALVGDVVRVVDVA
jgi:Beta propeller domain